VCPIIEEVKGKFIGKTDWDKIDQILCIGEGGIGEVLANNAITEGVNTGGFDKLSNRQLTLFSVNSFQGQIILDQH